jgi:hypothetical protein
MACGSGGACEIDEAAMTLPASAARVERLTDYFDSVSPG